MNGFFWGLHLRPDNFSVTRVDREVSHKSCHFLSWSPRNRLGHSPHPRPRPPACCPPPGGCSASSPSLPRQAGRSGCLQSLRARGARATSTGRTLNCKWRLLLIAAVDGPAGAAGGWKARTTAPVNNQSLQDFCNPFLLADFQVCSIILLLN